MTVTINRLEIENVKRIKAVKIEPSATGLTIVGGNNNQGKTSVLDAIAWALVAISTSLARLSARAHRYHRHLKS